MTSSATLSIRCFEARDTDAVVALWQQAFPEYRDVTRPQRNPHLSIANNQWRTTRTDLRALAIVHGPQAYVSPSWYPSKLEHGRAVPTWNYVAVHFTGQVAFHPEPEWLRDIVTRLTDKHEMGRADRWHVTDAPDSYIEGQLRGIVGVELLIERVEAKAKLSQNRSEADQAGAVDGLRAESTATAGEIADWMEHRAFS